MNHFECKEDDGNVSVVDISNRRNMSEIPENVLALKTVQILLCSRNSLKTVSPGIARLHCLIELDLSHNSLQQIPRQIGQLSNLRHLNLSHNQLTSLPSEIHNLHQLETLKCSSNKLVRLPSTLHRMTNLTLFTIDHNPLQYPPLEVACRGLLHIMKYLAKTNHHQHETSLLNWLANRSEPTNSAHPTSKPKTDDSDELSRELSRQKTEYSVKRAEAHLLKMEMFRKYSETEGKRQKMREAARINHARQLALFERKRQDAREVLMYSKRYWTDPESTTNYDQQSTHSRSSSVHSRSSKSLLKPISQDSSDFTMRRHIQQVRDDIRLLNQLRGVLESHLNVGRLEVDLLPKALSDGVMLCHLINRLHPRIVPTIHVPGPNSPGISLAKSRRNVEYFFDGCRKLGATANAEDAECSVQDVLEGKQTSKLARLINDLLDRTCK